MRRALGIAKSRLTKTLIPHKLAVSNFTQESRTPVELHPCSELRAYIFFCQCPSLAKPTIHYQEPKVAKASPLHYLESMLFINNNNKKERTCTRTIAQEKILWNLISIHFSYVRPAEIYSMCLIKIFTTRLPESFKISNLIIKISISVQ